MKNLLLRSGLGVALMLLFLAPAALGQTCDTEVTATSGGAGLVSALGSATANDIICVEAGTYSPGTNRTNSFSIPGDVTVVGGFPVGSITTGTTTVADRPAGFHSTSPTILDGDWDDSNTDAVGDATANYKVVVITQAGAVLDGVIVQGGNDDRATSATNADGVGGGITIDGGGASSVSATIQNSILRQNHSTANGAAVVGVNAGYTLINVLVTDNGGAASASQVVAAAGGRTGLLAADSDYPVSIINTTIAFNGGPAFFDAQAIATVTLTMENSIMYNNATDLPGGSATFQEPGATLTNVIDEQSSTQCGTGGVAGGCTNVIDTDPNLDNSAGLSELPLSSAAIDFGDDSLVPAGITKDGNGFPRFLAASVDAGWLEFVDTNPDITLVPSPSLDLGTILDNAAPVIGTFEIRNDGQSDLEVLSISPNPGSDLGYTVVSAPSGGTLIGPGNAETVEVEFSPTVGDLGTKTLTLSIETTDPDESEVEYDVTIEVTGAAPNITANGSNPAPTVDFGTLQPSGTASQTIVIGNDGTADLNISALTLTGTDAGLFTVTSPTPGTITPGSSDNVTVEFTGSPTDGTFSAALEITSNDPDDSPFSIPLQAVVATDPPIFAQAVNDGVVGKDLDPGDVFIVEIVVGTSAIPVADLAGVGFEFNFDPALFQVSGAVQAGDFISNSGADNVLVFENVDNATGVLSGSVARQAIGGTVAGVSGDGVVASFQVTTADHPFPESLPFDATFTITGEQATTPDPDGTGPLPPSFIGLTPQATTVTIVNRVEVFPGDTDDAGTVRGTDLFPIGDCFAVSVPPRTAVDINFEPKDATPLVYPDPFSNVPTLPASCVAGTFAGPTPDPVFADANGSGAIDQNDALAVGINFGRSQSEYPATKMEPGEGPKVDSTSGSKTKGEVARITLQPEPVGSAYVVDIVLGTESAPVDNVEGVSVRLRLPAGLLSLSDSAPGDFLDNGDLLTVKAFDAETGIAEVAYTRKAGAEPISGHGEVVQLVLAVDETLGAPVEVVLDAVELNVFAAPLASTDNASIAFDRVSAVSNEEVTDVPTSFALEAAYPNPFNPQTTIAYKLAEASEVRLTVYDMLGREVATLVNGQQQAAGSYEVVFDAAGLPSGTYIYRLQTEAHVEARTVQLIK